LGAGVAVLTAMALRPLYLPSAQKYEEGLSKEGNSNMDETAKEAINPKVVCFAYGVPGGTIDKRTSEEMTSYVTSIVLGSDAIPRTSFMSICKLRDDVLDTIVRAKVSKARIVRSLLFGGGGFSENEAGDSDVEGGDEIDSRDYLYDPKDVPDSQFKHEVEKFKVSFEACCLFSDLCCSLIFIHS
jgi:hypothetical protein